MKLRHGVFIAGLFAVVLPILASQRGPGSGTPFYDVKTEVKVRGTVQDILSQSGRGGWEGTHLVLKTDTGEVDVHVGPSAYIEKQQFSFSKGDVIELTGSRVQMAGKDTILAREIVKEGKTLSLRDKNGFPLWARRGRRSGS